VFSSDWISGLNGSMTIEIDGDKAWYLIKQLLWTKATLLLQFPEGGQRYIRLTSRGGPRIRKATCVATPSGIDWHRVVSVDFKEVARARVLA
jgi:hypothetical protein